jgi:hypothetical protein
MLFARYRLKRAMVVVFLANFFKLTWQAPSVPQIVNQTIGRGDLRELR